MPEIKAESTSNAGAGLWGAFVDALKAWPGLIAVTLRTRPGGWLVIALLPVAFLVWLTHWFCFLLDEVLFPSHRRIVIKQPFFIIGPPRSGTTHLHRIMAGHAEAFTSTRAWELFLAPSITQKKLLLLVARTDRRCGGWLRRLVDKSERSFTKSTGHLHQSSLTQPEEDFYFLLMALACPALVVVLPGYQRVWQSAFFVRAPASSRQAWLHLYYRCLQKHLAVFGEGRRLLSKNASANPWLPDLARMFPDASFAVCSRDPAEAIASMNSLAARVREELSTRELSTPNQPDEPLTALMHHHYTCLHQALAQLPDIRWHIVPMEAMRHDLAATVRALCEHTGTPVTPAFASHLQAAAVEAAHYRSGHQYERDTTQHEDPALTAARHFLNARSSGTTTQEAAA